MASYATIPAEAEAEKPLLNRDLRVNLKTVIGGAAVASFVLGALAAAVEDRVVYGESCDHEKQHWKIIQL